MNKIVVNNEIILMRHEVRKARVGIIWKLTKEAKLLKARKHGNDKIIEKCKRKAQKLVDEIKILKKVQEDEASKFAISNTRSLQEVLSDPSVNIKTRVLTKLSFHKVLKTRVEKFKEKFPEYEQYLGPGRKAMQKLKIQEKKNSRNDQGDKATRNPEREVNNRVHNFEKNKLEGRETSVKFDEVCSLFSGKECEETFPESEEVKLKSVDRCFNDKTYESQPEKLGFEEKKDIKIYRISKMHVNKPIKKQNLENNVESDESEAKKSQIQNNNNSKKSPTLKSQIIIPSKEKKLDNIKIISNLASVKRFKLDSDQDDNVKEISDKVPEDVNLNEEKVYLQKEENSFFFTGYDGTKYQQICIPKSSLSQDNSQEQNDKFSRNHCNNRDFSKNVDPKNNFPRNKQYNSSNDRRDSSNARQSFSKRENSSFEPSNDYQNKFEREKESMKRNEMNEKQLHPSWLARKKQQDILKQGPQGKKIVFGDD